ncbi:MAG: cysteine peptidase family C39 domain-containing protein, partial [bacterium]
MRSTTRVWNHPLTLRARLLRARLIEWWWRMRGGADGCPPKLRKATPLLLQLEATECGAAALGVILAHFDRRVPISELREACAVGRDGCDAADLMRAARQYGLSVQGWKKEPHHIPKMKLPAIIFWEFNHFLVLEGYGRNCFYLNDPGNGHRVVDDKEFDRGFTGVILTFKPGPEFATGGAREGIWHRIRPWLRDVKRPLAFAVCCGLLLALPALALPLLLNIFVDHVLSGREPSWGGVLVGALLAAAAGLYLLSWLRARCLNFLAVRLSVIHSDRFLHRLFKVPMKYFAHRFVGDLTARMQSIDKISSVATSQFVGIIIELFTSALFLLMMLAYDPLMCAVVVALGALSAISMRALTRLRTDENRKLQR